MAFRLAYYFIQLGQSYLLVISSILYIPYHANHGFLALLSLYLRLVYCGILIFIINLQQHLCPRCFNLYLDAFMHNSTCKFHDIDWSLIYVCNSKVMWGGEIPWEREEKVKFVMSQCGCRGGRICLLQFGLNYGAKGLLLRERGMFVEPWKEGCFG